MAKQEENRKHLSITNSGTQQENLMPDICIIKKTLVNHRILMSSSWESYLDPFDNYSNLHDLWSRTPL